MLLTVGLLGVVWIRIVGMVRALLIWRSVSSVGVKSRLGCWEGRVGFISLGRQLLGRDGVTGASV